MDQENTLLTEQEVLARLARGKALYQPLEIVSVKGASRGDCGFDARVTVGWRRQRVDFIAGVKARTAPKLIDEGLQRLKSCQGRRKLLIVPFLSKTIVEMLEREGLSGIDLNGNYLIQSPEMSAIRLDRENQFRESQPIKKIFSQNSSLVARVFVSSKRRPFDSVNEVFSAIRDLGGSLSLSAISKVLKGLEDELIIEKNREKITLIQPDKLLQRLEEDYRPPKIMETIRIKIPGAKPLRDLDKILSRGARWILSGESSAERYAVTTPAEIFTIYVTDFGDLSRYEDERFCNVILKKTSDSFPYFDARERDRLRWSSPVQCYLELSKLGKREKELAGAVRQSILEELK